MGSNKLNCNFSAASSQAHILVPYSNSKEQDEHVLRKTCCHYAQPETKYKDATVKVVC